VFLVRKQQVTDTAALTSDEKQGADDEISGKPEAKVGTEVEEEKKSDVDAEDKNEKVVEDNIDTAQEVKDAASEGKGDPTSEGASDEEEAEQDDTTASDDAVDANDDQQLDSQGTASDSATGDIQAKDIKVDSAAPVDDSTAKKGNDIAKEPKKNGKDPKPKPRNNRGGEDKQIHPTPMRKQQGETDRREGGNKAKTQDGKGATKNDKKPKGPAVDYAAVFNQAPLDCFSKPGDKNGLGFWRGGADFHFNHLENGASTVEISAVCF
jgi:hypothetical protein